jgi:hypothetical protein
MSGAAVQISRGALFAMGTGAGSLYLYSNGLVPPGLLGDMSRLVARSGLTLPSGAGAGAGVGAQQAAEAAQLNALNLQLAELSREMARLRLQAQYGGAVRACDSVSVSAVAAPRVPGFD